MVRHTEKIFSVSQRSIAESSAHWQTARGEMRLGFSDRVFPEMKNAGGQHGVGFSTLQNIGEMFEFPSASAGDDRNVLTSMARYYPPSVIEDPRQVRVGDTHSPCGHRVV